MKFLHLLIFFYLHIFTNSIKINNRIIYNALFKDDFIAKPNTLAIQQKKLFSKEYNNIKFSGKDERYPENEELELDKVYENIQNKKCLDILEDNNISIYKKLELLSDKSIKPSNLHAGGLMKDFEFDIEI